MAFRPALCIGISIPRLERENDHSLLFQTQSSGMDWGSTLLHQQNGTYVFLVFTGRQIISVELWNDGSDRNGPRKGWDHVIPAPLLAEMSWKAAEDLGFVVKKSTMICSGESSLCRHSDFSVWSAGRHAIREGERRPIHEGVTANTDGLRWIKIELCGDRILGKLVGRQIARETWIESFVNPGFAFRILLHGVALPIGEAKLVGNEKTVGKELSGDVFLEGSVNITLLSLSLVNGILFWLLR
jgi:hypothetical protein